MFASALAGRMAGGRFASPGMAALASAVATRLGPARTQGPSFASAVAMRLNEALAGKVASAAMKRIDTATIDNMASGITAQLRGVLEQPQPSSGKPSSAGQPDLPAAKTKI